MKGGQKQDLKKIKDSPVPQRTALSTPKLFLLLGSIVLITYLSFLPATKNNFINWDDNAYVFYNEHLNKPISEAIPYFFGTHYFVGNYIPLTMITYMLEFHVAGLKPQFFHTFNVILHLINVLLVFWFIYLLSEKKPLVAGLVALFFGIHPMHVESVAWIAELKDLLYSVFFLSGLIVYYIYLKKSGFSSNSIPARSSETQPRNEKEKNKTKHLLLLVLLFFVLSLLSKPAAIIFPLVLLLLDYYTGRRLSASVWIEKIPFFLFSLLFSVIAINAQQADRLLHDVHPLSHRLLFASHSVLEYLSKLFYPAPLSIFYPYPSPVNGQLPTEYYLAPLIVFVLAYGVYRTIKHTRLIAFGLLFYFTNVILILQLVSIGDAIVADRYTYISYIGLFFILAMGIDKFYHSSQPKWQVFKPVVWFLVFVLAGTSAYRSYSRCKVWNNDDTIATDLLSKFPNDWLALNNKGFILFEQSKYYEAVSLFTKAIERKPDYTRAHINLINSYLALNDLSSAQTAADSALYHVPLDHNVLNKRGQVLSSQQKYHEAIAMHRQAIHQKNNDLYGYMFLAECYYNLKDKTSALSTLDEALKLFPENYILLNSKGYILFELREYKQALAYFKQSLRIKPDYSIAQVNLADCNRALRDSSYTHK